MPVFNCSSLEGWGFPMLTDDYIKGTLSSDKTDETVFQVIYRDGKLASSPAQLSMLLEGIDWRAPERTWRPLTSG